MRISFGGGGTDLPAYYEQYGGLVVSTSIGYTFQTVLNTAPRRDVQILSAEHLAHLRCGSPEDSASNGDLRLPRAVVDFFNPKRGLLVFLASEVPPGSGLGECGALAVSMIKALSFCCGIDLAAGAAADIACQIQIDKLGMPVGKQDQLAAAFGGVNRMTFSAEGVSVEALDLAPETEEALERRLMLFFTGVSPSSSNLLHRLRQRIVDKDPNVLSRLGVLKELASGISTALEEGELPVFGELLHRSWLEKRLLTDGITNAFIDRCYQLARSHGAVGGKIGGPGGGGFLILYCPEEHQDTVIRALKPEGLDWWPLSLDRSGVQLMQAKPWQRPTWTTSPVR